MLKTKNGQRVTVSYKNADLECLVHHFKVVPPWSGSMYTAPSDLDYYGYTEIDWELLGEWVDGVLVPAGKRYMGDSALEERLIETLKEEIY